MNVKILAATVSIVSLSWLGLSFATPADPSDLLFPSIGSGPVSAESPDSHRLGVVLKEEVALPAWESAPSSGTELALVNVE